MNPRVVLQVLVARLEPLVGHLRPTRNDQEEIAQLQAGQLHLVDALKEASPRTTILGSLRQL